MRFPFYSARSFRRKRQKSCPSIRNVRLCVLHFPGWNGKACLAKLNLRKALVVRNRLCPGMIVASTLLPARKIDYKSIAAGTIANFVPVFAKYTAERQTGKFHFPTDESRSTLAVLKFPFSLRRYHFFRGNSSRAQRTTEKDTRQKKAEINGPESGRFVARHGFTLHLIDAGLAEPTFAKKGSR